MFLVGTQCTVRVACFTLYDRFKLKFKIYLSDDVMQIQSTPAHLRNSDAETVHSSGEYDRLFAYEKDAEFHNLINGI